MRDEMESKFNKYDGVVDSFKSEMNQVKASIKQLDYIKSISKPSGLSTLKLDSNQNKIIGDIVRYVFDSMIQIDSKCKWMEANFCKEKERIYAMLSELSDRNHESEQAVLNIAEVIASLNYKPDHVGNAKHQVDSDEIDSLTNAIECMQQQLNKLDISVMKNNEKLMKMNEQIHVLSAKYIKFNAQINNHILDYNKKSTSKINREQVIDRDVELYLLKEKVAIETKDTLHNVKQIPTNGKISAVQHNTFCVSNDPELTANRFNDKYSKHVYSKYLKIRIQKIHINNSALFINEIKKKLKNTVGANVVNNVIATKYRTSNGITHQIDVIVSFNIPIGYEYLNQFKFPNNWSFLEYTVRSFHGNHQ